MSDRNPHPPVQPLASDLVAAAAMGHDITTRLAALDQLYESRQITATELGEARRQILASAEAPRTAQIPASSEPAQASSTAPVVTPSTLAASGSGAGGSPPPTQVVTGHVGAPEPPPEKKIAGLPVWAAAAIVGVAIVAVAALAFLLLNGGGDSSSASAPGQAYANQIKRPLSQLTVSAVVTGKALGRVSQPGQIRAFNRLADRQLDVVESARRRLSAVEVAPGDRRAHGRLLAAAASQRGYLVLLGRASAGRPDRASMAAVNRARQAGGRTIHAYRTFFVLAPAAPDAITTTDLTDLKGLRSAISKSVAAGSTGRGPTGSSSPGVPLTSLFIGSDAGDPSDVCFGPGRRPTAVASLTLSGTRYYSGIVQCGNSQAGPYAANGRLRFDTSSISGRIIGVGGTFGIDEASSSQRGATATFTVRYGGQVLCQVTVSWGVPRSCSPIAGPVPANGSDLTIDQSVTPARRDRGLWAGVVDPSLILG